MDGMMEIPGPALDHEEWSDNEFEGYVDDSSEQQQRDSQMWMLKTLTDCEVGEADFSSEIPAYTLSPGCNPPRQNATPLELFKMLLSDSILDKIVDELVRKPVYTK